MTHLSTTINQRYHLLRLLGSGGMGDVYAAHDTMLGRNLALKLLRPDLATDEDARERFLREAQIAAQIVHPNVVRTYDVGDAPQGPFLIQELLEGHTLDTVLPLPPAQALRIALALADALDHIHKQGFVHCDIKPQNIMLIPQQHGERVVLLDFGIARADGVDTTSLIVTPHYAAPEQTRGEAPTAATDLYALGIVLYQTLTGRLPFDATTVQRLIEAHRSAPLPPLNLDMPHAAAIKRIVRRLTEKDPAARYPSAAAVRHDLQSVLDALVDTRPLRWATRSIPTLPLGRRAWAAAIPLLIGGLIVGAAWSRGSFSSDVDLDNARRVVSAQPVTRMITLPDVRGLPLAEAQRQIEQSGLIASVGEALTSDQPAGTVVSMIPAAGQSLASGSTVVLIVSAGPPPTATPAPSEPPAEPTAVPTASAPVLAEAPAAQEEPRPATIERVVNPVAEPAPSQSEPAAPPAEDKQKAEATAAGKPAAPPPAAATKPSTAGGGSKRGNAAPPPQTGPPAHANAPPHAGPPAHANAPAAGKPAAPPKPPAAGKPDTPGNSGKAPGNSGNPPGKKGR